ncbi:YceI family protein [Dyella mobilis]|uniref:YceI family protein n=1 Tax=Dyella mobilis TaxID=1849582 RepID=A0ABS2KCT6_9GAMM|nr:YceI family protein [Dyella mobilis]MBM7128991.1 YceI family protein [Dyella mobilis]GLQ99315.1 polyisoprenoid-binding protein [Dyella mobilis]
MKSCNATVTIAASLLLFTSVAMAFQQGRGSAEDATASSQYKALNLTKDPTVAAEGYYKLDPHHTSVTAKLAHMDLSHYTLRFDTVSGGFSFEPAHATASDLQISIDPKSVDTGDAGFDKRIAARFFQADEYSSIAFTSSSVTITGDHFSVDGTLNFHGVKKPMHLNVVYRGFTQGRMGFSGEATFKRSEFGVGEWVPLEADEVTILIETEFVKT